MSAQLDKLAKDMADADTRTRKAAAALTIAEANYNDAEAEKERLGKAFDEEVARIKEAAKNPDQIAVERMQKAAA